VYLSSGAIDASFSDNYFDVLPGETIEIMATTNATRDELKAQLKVISLTDAFAPPQAPATVSAAH
jgi:beta-mannosidase